MPIPAIESTYYKFPLSFRQEKTKGVKVNREDSVRVDKIKVTSGLHSDVEIQRDLPRKRQRHFGLLYAGVFLLMGGTLLLAFNPAQAIIKWQAEFREGSLIFNIWKRAPVKVNLIYHIFNYTNTEAFLRGEEKLRMEEVGPYVYDEFIEFTNITFNKNNTFSYIPVRTAAANPTLTAGDPVSDVIIAPNLAFLGMASYLHDSSFFTNVGFNVFSNLVKSQPFLNVTVDEFLWGYDEPLLDYASKILPQTIPFSKIGYLAMLCNEGANVVTVGLNLETETRSNGQVIEPLTIDKYNGSPGLPHYGFEDDDNSTHLPCNTLQGVVSEGITLPRKSYATDKVALYRKYFCRSLPITFGNHTHTSLGLPAMLFNVTRTAHHNSLTINSCYCDEEAGPCLPDGLSDISTCFFGMPVALSNPHFLHGDPALAAAWDSLSPDEEKHNSHALVEPEFGIMLRGHMRLQANLVMKNTKYNGKVQRLKNMVLPLFWVDYYLNDIPMILHLLMYVCLVIVPILHVMVIATMFFSGFLLVILFCRKYQSKW